jgi:Kef-type K+ transport system membrane component KefB
MIFFFVLAGAALDFGSLGEIGMITIAFLILRTLGRLLGGWMGGLLVGAPAMHRRWTGLALLPQAGVALGMALVGANYFPELARSLLAITISATIVCEVIGPFLTLLALRMAGED